MSISDILEAEAGKDIKKGQMVKLIAIPLDEDSFPSAVSLDNADEGEQIRITGKAHVFGQIDD